MSSLLSGVLQERGVYQIDPDSIFPSKKDKRQLLLAMQDISAFKGLCPDHESNRDCARQVHDIDPFLSIVTLVEDLPKAPYFPAIGRDRGKVNLPGGYSVASRIENRGVDRVHAELLIAGFTEPQVKLLIEGEDKRRIAAIHVPRETALALVRIVKDDFERIASSRINANDHEGAFEELTREQQAGLIYAAWNTGTVYKDAARSVRRLVSVQRNIHTQIREGSEVQAQGLIVSAASLMSDIKTQITPSFRVFKNGKADGFVKNHRVGGYIHAWLSGRGGEVVLDSRQFELSSERMKYGLDRQEAMSALFKAYDVQEHAKAMPTAGERPGKKRVQNDLMSQNDESGSDAERPRG